MTCCERCQGPVGPKPGKPVAYPNEYGEFICDDCEQNAAERAYERFCEAFYGGEVVTLHEQQIEARKLK